MNPNYPAKETLIEGFKSITSGLLLIAGGLCDLADFCIHFTLRVLRTL